MSTLAAPAPELALRIEHLTKTFPGQVALEDVSIEVRRGEVHALIGQNGSGKSTLIKILSGFHRPDHGSSAWLDGAPVTLGALSEGERRRVHFIHQDLALVPTLSARENLALDRPGRALLPLHPRDEARWVRALLGDFNVEIDINAPVRQLRPYEQSAIAISRALSRSQDDALLLVLDEPTASFGRAEVESLFAALRRIRDRGVGIIYVSHFLTEIVEIADRVSVLRDGRLVDTRDVAGTSEATLVELMIGRRLESVRLEREAASLGEVVLSVDGLCAHGLEEISFEVRAGEILGLTGVVGSGFEAIPHCLLGSQRLTAGSVTIAGRRFDRLRPAQAIAAGLAMAPADRRRLGLIPHFTLSENTVLPRLHDLWRSWRLSRLAERRDVVAWLERTNVVPPDPGKRLGELSGGNQQKVMIAKWLRLQPPVLVLAEPTQAVDVGARAAIEELIIAAAAEGRGIVVASADPEELARICHRVLVTRDGRVHTVLGAGELSEARLIVESQPPTESEPARGAA